MISGPVVRSSPWVHPVGKVRYVHLAALTAGITYSSEELLGSAFETLEEMFGPIEFSSESFDFTMTDYYAAEMGENLKKLFCCFARPIHTESLPDIKLRTNELELVTATGNTENPRRRVNIDPGYITLSKLVLASTKDYSHRIYVGKGIYAEVTLRYQGNTFVPIDTTYPDYRTSLAIDFFNKVRGFVKGKRHQWMQEHA